MTATAPSRVDLAPAAAAAAPIQRVVAWCVGWLGSMKLAVVLVLLLALLTWLGTLAQGEGISNHEVQRQYFESWIVIARLPLSLWGKTLYTLDDGTAWGLRIPLPGAYPVLALLFLNLIVGGFVRLKWSVRNIGIFVIHFGIGFLLIAGLVKLHYSFSGNMMLYETPTNGNELKGRSYLSSRFASFHDYELALLTDKGDRIEERVVPEAQLWPARDDGSVTVRAEGLPFVVKVHHFVDHSSVLPKGPMVHTTMPILDGAFLNVEQWKPGEEAKSEQEIAGCYVTVIPDAGVQATPAKPEAILWGFSRTPMDERAYPFAFTVGGQRYGLDLRHTLYDLPFSIRLDKFVKEDHPGTRSPKEFRSFISVIDGPQQPQEAQVFMNNPLRRDGYVAYQSGWGPQPMGGPPWYTGLEIAYNPSDMWPKLACFVIAAGMLIHFVAKLWRFLGSSTQKALQG